MEEKKLQLIKDFEELFGAGGEIRTYFAPGRVNLIGEHTDYNGGHVFPCALTIGTYAVVRRREDSKLRFHSLNFPQTGIIESSLQDLDYNRRNGWTNYLKGVFWSFIHKGYKVTHGFDIMIFGNIPNGSGLSSSASIEVLMGVMLKDMFDFDVSMIDISLICQYSENVYNKVNCGIMDQFSIAMGKEDNAIFLDTSDLSYRYAPIKLDDYDLVIACSNKKRGLNDSKYNERRNECDTSLAELKKILNIDSLGELTNEAFEDVKEIISDPVRVRRVRHAVSENQRTIEAVKALDAGDLVRFGKLMDESHISLRDDYEVTGIELDTLVEAAWEQEGVLGSRMTGAGFGGCTVSIVRKDCVESFMKNVAAKYYAKIGYQADFYPVNIGNGARRI